MISDEVKAIRAALYAAYNDDRPASKMSGPSGFTQEAEKLLERLKEIEATKIPNHQRTQF